MNRLAQLRKERGMKQQEVADSVGMKIRTYRSYETEERELNSDLMRIFADFYDVTVDYLICRTDKREKEDVHDEVMELRQMMRERPELAFLMKLTKNAKTSDILQASALLQKLKEESENK